MENKNIAAIVDEVARAFGFSSAAQVANMLAEHYMAPKDESHFMGALQIIYAETVGEQVSRTEFFVYDLVPEGDIVSFYCLSPAVGPDLTERTKKLQEFAWTINSPEDYMAVVNDPSMCPVPVQREFHVIMPVNYSLIGVVNYTESKSSGAITFLQRRNFSPMIATSRTDVKDGTVTPLRPKK